METLEKLLAILVTGCVIMVMLFFIAVSYQAVKAGSVVLANDIHYLFYGGE